MVIKGHTHTHGPRAEDLARCVHCGFCLQACPTYLVLGMETESPRGRIHLARAVSEGRAPVTPSVVQHFDLCLQCRACETACPSGVPYGRIMEATRAMVQSNPGRPPIWRLRSLGLRLLFGAPWRLRLAFGALRLYQRTLLAPLMRRVLPRRLRQMQEMLPQLPRRPFDAAGVLAEPESPRASVAMLTGCVMPLTYPRTHEATVRVLARNGCRVVAPPAQVCCGALHLHNGDPEAARRLARRNIDVFLAEGVDAIVVNSAGCGSAMKEYRDLFRDDTAYADKAARFSALVKDVAEFLVDLPFEPPMGRVEAKVTYQDSCHLVHAQRIRDAPRVLLQSVPGLDFIEMPASDRCCGSAGIYNFTQPEMSRRLLVDKMADVASTGTDLLATANPGCMLQLEVGVRKHGGAKEVVHVVELLDRAYGAEAPESA
jgi:Fe-S oxidoreductase